MAVTIRSEKGSALSYSEMDQNFIELRNVINEANGNTQTVNQLETDVSNLSTQVSDLQTNTLKISENLNDLQSTATARTNLNVYSQTESDNRYFQIANNLSELTDIQGFLDTLGVKSNAERDIFISDQLPDSAQGVEGDLWYEYGVVISSNV